VPVSGAATDLDLTPVWAFATGVVEGHEARPIIDNGVMFLATPMGKSTRSTPRPATEPPLCCKISQGFTPAELSNRPRGAANKNGGWRCQKCLASVRGFSGVVFVIVLLRTQAAHSREDIV
jgi:hypothetical protein